MSYWKFKLIVFKTLSVLPNKIGDILYLFFQKVLNTNNAKISLLETRKTLNNFEKIILKETNIKINTVAELGSGWSPSLPYILIKEKQIKSVESFDLNKWYSSGRIKLVNDQFNLNLNCQKSLIPELKYHPRTDISKINLDKNINFLISRHVLEHVKPNVIIDIHKNFINNLDSHYVLHYVSPSDHRAYSDKSVLLHDFLKYDEKEWSELTTRFDYHNRMRLPEYRMMFNKLGYKVIYEDYNKQSDDYIKKFKKINLNKRFSNFKPFENVAGRLIFFMKHENI